MDPDSRLHTTQNSLKIARLHLQEGLTPSMVFFASQAAQTALKTVYMYKINGSVQDLLLSQVLRGIAHWTPPVSDDLIMVFEDLAPRCEHPESLALLIQEIPVNRAEYILEHCEQVVLWAHNQLIS